MQTIEDHRLEAALTALDSAVSSIASAPLEMASNAVRLDVLERLETTVRRLSGIGHQAIQLVDENSTPADFGNSRLQHVLADRLRITPADARRRVSEAADLAIRTTLTG